MNAEKTYDFIVKSLKEYFQKTGFERAVIGLSGGIDSALVLSIAVEAIGSRNVTALLLPELGLTEKENIDDSIELAKSLRAKHHIIPINDFVETLRKTTPYAIQDFAVAQFKPRIRMALLYAYANNYHSLVVGTSNKSELLLGYFTKYGDGGTDVAPIADLLKTEVIALAKHAGVPRKFIDKKPSAELMPEQTDEKEIGFSYKELDEVLKEHAKGRKFHQMQKKFPTKILARTEELMKLNEHKAKGPFIIRVPENVK